MILIRGLVFPHVLLNLSVTVRVFLWLSLIFFHLLIFILSFFGFPILSSIGANFCELILLQTLFLFLQAYFSEAKVVIGANYCAFFNFLIFPQFVIFLFSTLRSPSKEGQSSDYIVHIFITFFPLLFFILSANFFTSRPTIFFAPSSSSFNFIHFILVLFFFSHSVRSTIWRVAFSGFPALSASFFLINF